MTSSHTTNSSQSADMSDEQRYSHLPARRAFRELLRRYQDRDKSVTDLDLQLARNDMIAEYDAVRGAESPNE